MGDWRARESFLSSLLLVFLVFVPGIFLANNNSGSVFSLSGGGCDGGGVSCGQLRLPNC